MKFTDDGAAAAPGTGDGDASAPATEASKASSGSHPLFIAGGYWGGFGKARRRPGFFAATDWGVMEVRGVDDDDRKVFIGGVASCLRVRIPYSTFVGLGYTDKLVGYVEPIEPNVDSET